MLHDKNIVPIKLVDALIGEEEIQAVTRTMRSGQLAQGPEVAAFEREFADVVGTRHAVCVNSGTAAIHCALEAFGIGRGDEVVTTPFTFAATATPILMQGAVPKFVDIDAKTYNADLSSLAAAAGLKTRAVIAVDLFGLPVDLAGADALRGRGIPIIEDACQAVGASRDGKQAGALGDAGCFSFYATKNIMAGEGGMLTTDNDEVAAAARRFRQHGQGLRYEYLSLGYNYRMTDVLAAIGRVQLSRLEEIGSARRRNAALYDEGLRHVTGITTPTRVPGAVHAYHQYSILIDPTRTRNGKGRDAVRAQLAEREIASGAYYPTPLHLNPLFASLGYRRGDFPISERISNEILALPVHPRVSADDVRRVCAAIGEIVSA